MPDKTTFTQPGNRGIQGIASCGCDGTYVTNTYVVCNHNCRKWRDPDFNPYDEDVWFRGATVLHHKNKW